MYYCVVASIWMQKKATTWKSRSPWNYRFKIQTIVWLQRINQWSLSLSMVFVFRSLGHWVLCFWGCCGGHCHSFCFDIRPKKIISPVVFAKACVSAFVKNVPFAPTYPSHTCFESDGRSIWKESVVQSCNDSMTVLASKPGCHPPTVNAHGRRHWSSSVEGLPYVSSIPTS